MESIDVSVDVYFYSYVRSICQSYTSTRSISTIYMNHSTEIKSCKKLDAFAKVYISKALDDQYHTYVRGCSTSKTMWNAIKAVREQQSHTHVLLATQSWHAFSWQPHHVMSSFLAELNQLRQNVKSLGGSLELQNCYWKDTPMSPFRFHPFRIS